MADEKSRDTNQQQGQGNEKAQGATATAGGQGQQGTRAKVSKDRARVSKDRVANRTLNLPDRAAASRALDSVNRARARVARVVKTSRVAASGIKVPGRVDKAANRESDF